MSKTSVRVALLAFGVGTSGIVAMFAALVAQAGPAVGLEGWTFAGAGIGVLGLLTAAHASQRADAGRGPGIAVPLLVLTALAALAWLLALLLTVGEAWFPDCSPTCGPGPP